MKTFFKYFVFFVLSCSCFTAISKDTSFLVGNNAGVGDGNFNGPSTAAQVTFRYASTTNNLVFYKPTQLGPTGVKLRWEQLDTASGGGFLYCNASDRANPDGLMDIENAMADSGKTYGGHKLFKTSVPGLYYTLFIAKLWSAYSTKTTISDSGLYIGDTTPQKFQWIITDPDLQHIGCDNAMRYDRFWAIGGVVHDLTIEFYTDTDFNPTTNQDVSLSSNSTYLYAFKAYSPGSRVVDHSHHLYIDFDLLNVKLTNPTCFTAVLTGKSVSGSTVKMGEYAPGQIKNGATPVPFDISLQNCVRVGDIETKLSSGKLGTENKQLLGNTLTGSGAAKGVAVLIEGLANRKSALMILKPNDSTSVYKDNTGQAQDHDSDAIYPEDQGITYPLHFQATLKQDGNIAIEPGEFKATSTFQVTYP